MSATVLMDDGRRCMGGSIRSEKRERLTVHLARTRNGPISSSYKGHKRRAVSNVALGPFEESLKIGNGIKTPSLMCVQWEGRSRDSLKLANSDIRCGVAIAT